MRAYVEPILTATWLFPFIAILITLPYMLFQYWRYGSILLLRTTILFSFILYLMCAYFLTILPLPTREEVAALTTPYLQLQPFKDVAVWLQKSGAVLAQPATWLRLLNRDLFVMVANIIMTIPFGLYLRYYFRCSWKKTLLLTLILSMVDLSSIPGIPTDKHSTGGVGDTTTLVLAPLVAACGVPVAKMSGRGLGHTGGTLDKLESIQGFQVGLSMEDFIAQVQKIGLAVIGQTRDLAPADKALYALRDVTSTVDSLPLIASSIMSKKLASGAKAIVLDVKTGSGAIMHTLEESIELAQAMVRIGTDAGRRVVALVTDMGEPLGSHVGNALEVKEAIDVLSGRVTGPLLDVSLALGAQMLVAAYAAATAEEAEGRLLDALRSGHGLAKLKEMITAQGGNACVCDDVTLLPQAAVVRDVPAPTDGFIQSMLLNRRMFWNVRAIPSETISNVFFPTMDLPISKISPSVGR